MICPISDSQIQNAEQLPCLSAFRPVETGLGPREPILAVSYQYQSYYSHLR
jgi:hypothetical protein